MLQPRPASLVGYPRHQLRLGGRLLAGLAVRADALLNWGRFPSCFRLAPGLCDGLMVNPGLLGELPVGLLGLRCYQLGEKLALLLGGEVPPADVLRNDI